jgi:hypothetical protein
MPIYRVTVNMGFCGADFIEDIEADNAEAAAEAGHEAALQDVDSGVAELLCEDCQEVIEDCECNED